MTRDPKLATVSTRPARQQHTTSTLLTIFQHSRPLKHSRNYYVVRYKGRPDQCLPLMLDDDTLIHFLCVMVWEMTHNLTHAFWNAKNCELWIS
jgi:hypothetical protein